MGNVILITGGSSGMGLETAKLLAQEGYKVYAGARRTERLEALRELGIVPVQMDVTDPETNQKVVEQIMANEGRIDVLINNAGFGLYGPVEDVSLEDARYQFDVNLFGLAHLTQLVLPHMRQQKSGRIINTSSMGGKIYTPLGAWYHATKHALEGCPIVCVLRRNRSIFRLYWSNLVASKRSLAMSPESNCKSITTTVPIRNRWSLF